MGEDTDNNLGMITLPACKCRCGHIWVPRQEGRPGVCPSCKSYKWDKPYDRLPKKAAKKRGRA